MGSCAAPSAKGDDKFITTDYLQQCLLTNALPVLAGQHGPEYLHHLPATFLLISSRHAAAEDSTMSWGSTSPRSSC
ncbi:hypothetical protein AAB23_21970 [Salmonella enterica subsp. enterica serovar Typhimurium]|nr:hypothetical protein [Salmonella enterica subsp. enterica serovar Typhimurium]